MSVRVITMVWDQFPGKGPELLAMLAFADWSDDHGRCYPSIASIAAKLRLSRSQAHRVVHGLIDAGYLSVLANHNGGDPGRTRLYQVELHAITGGMVETGSADATGSAHAQEGSHECGERGRAGAALTVIEPSRTVSPKKAADELVGFDRFWGSWPKGDRKQSRGRCLEVWKQKRFEKCADSIIRHVEHMKLSASWSDQSGRFVPAPLSYLKKRSWEGVELDEQPLLGTYV